MSSNNMSDLISGPSKTETSESEVVFPQNAIPAPTTPSSFSISHLLPELRHQIYNSYFSTLPPVAIMSGNSSLPLHALNPLALASPFFESDIPPGFYYQNARFIFSHGKDMQAFAGVEGTAETVRNIHSVWGKDESPTRDWVHLMSSCFIDLKTATFSLERGKQCFGFGGVEQFGAWWGCVRDAVREGLASGTTDRRSKRKGKGLVLRVEDGEWGVCERICVC